MSKAFYGKFDVLTRDAGVGGVVTCDYCGATLRTGYSGRKYMDARGRVVREHICDRCWEARNGVQVPQQGAV